MKDLTLILPTRQRLPQLRRALRSAAETAARPERLEVVLYIDRDDEPSHDFQFPGLQIVRLIGPRARMGQMTQTCFDAGSGRYLMLANDDIVFRSPGWDATVLETFAEFNDDVALIWGNDLYSGFPSHPFLSRSACQTIGMVCPDDYHHELIDVHIYDIFRKLRRLGHNRMRYLDQLVIEHRHIFAGKADPDQTYPKPHLIEDERTYLLWDEERQWAARALARQIEARAAGAARATARSEAA